MDNLFLSIDGIDIEDLEQGDYYAYEEELSVSARMIDGRRIEEVQGKVWVVGLRSNAISGEQMVELSRAIAANSQHELFFLPSNGGTELATGTFHLAERPQPALQRWTGEWPEWSGYELRFEEIECHD